MRRLCLCLLISLPALLAEPAHTTNNTLPQIEPAVDAKTLSSAQIREKVSAEITRAKTNEFANWLSFATVPDAINLVHGLMADPNLGLIQKEAILLRLTQHLRSTAPTAADRAVMLELTAYKSKVQTQHHDDPRYTQPAFNIAASAKGAINEWRYQELNAELSGTNIMQLWNTADTKDQRYILAGLRSGSLDQASLKGIHTITMQQQLDYPDLAMATAYGIGDLEAVIQMGSKVTSAMALSMLKTVAATDNSLNIETTTELLKSISNHLDPAIAGLALNLLATQQPDSEMIAGLVDQLSDKANGASAAMTLAQVLTDRQLQELHTRAGHNNKLLQARIKLIQQLRDEVQ